MRGEVPRRLMGAAAGAEPCRTWDFELSRFVVTGGITSAVEAIGPERVLFGSRFPDMAMSPQLYSLHHCGLSMDALAAICAGNAERLLGRG